MKIEFNDTIYNTAIAKPLGSWNNGRDKSDPYYCEETLYQRRTDRQFFIHGRSGATGKYATNTGKGWAAGEAIIPITDYGAQMWQRRRLNGEPVSWAKAKEGE